MNIVEKSIEELKAYEKNPRHNEKAVDAVAASIKEFGWKVPVVIDKDGVIAAGHTRVAAAKKLGIKTVPCIVADDLTEEQIRAFRLADNKTAELAEWDDELLAEELAMLEDIDMSQFGFEGLEEMLDETREATEDDFSEDEEEIEPVTKTGDIWVLGDHRLICGDSTQKDVIDRLMQGEKADMVFTDPPYGVSIGSKNKAINAVEPGRGGALRKTSKTTRSEKKNSTRCSSRHLQTFEKTEPQNIAVIMYQAHKAASSA